MFFEYPMLLWLLLIVLFLIAHYIYLELSGRNPHLRVSSLQQWHSSKKSFKLYLRHLPFVFRLLAIICIIFALARPRTSTTLQKMDSEGIDIFFDLDVSSSMLATDFDPNRVEAAKAIAIEFIAQRQFDRMGIVVFAGESYVQAPLTTDRPTLINLMNDVQTGLIDDGTAIGDGLATAVARLKESTAKSKVVILLTDGVNNSGAISPQTAADIAKEYNIRVYTIGVGSMGTASVPVMTDWGPEMRDMKVEIDEDLLKDMAAKTGGKYFRATDNTKLAEIYSEINQLEKSKVSVDNYPVYTELFIYFLYACLFALFLEFVLSCIIRRIN